MNIRGRQRWSQAGLLAGLVLASCGMPCLACSVSATPLAFGTINPLDGVQTTSVATVVVSCPSDAAYAIALSAGNGSYDLRRMSDGIDSLDYQVFADSSHSLVAGDGTAGTTTLSGSAGPSGTSHYLYGVVPAQRQAVPAAYSDTLIVTVSY